MFQNHRIREIISQKTCYNKSMNTQERRKKVERAIANQRLEGLSISNYTRSVLDDYVSGKISAHEAAQRVYSHYGAK